MTMTRRPTRTIGFIGLQATNTIGYYSYPYTKGLLMLHAYRLVYPISEHAPPQLWEYEQPYIDNLLRNARTFDRWVVQWYFENWEALDRDNTRIWNTY